MRPATGTLSLSAAIVAGAVALAGCGSSGGGSSAQSGEGQASAAHHTAMSQTMNNEGAEAVSSNGAAESVSPTSVKLVVKSDEEKGEKGADGKYHDAFIPASFTVKPGQKVTVTVYNYDDMKHSFTDSGVGVNATIAAGSAKQPSKTTFTFTAPKKAGEYEWFCSYPCDPYSMSHKGLMRGEVTVS